MAPRLEHVHLRGELTGLAARIGVRADQHVRDVLDAAVSAMRARGREDLDRYVADLVSGREVPEPWIEEVVVQETYLFRDLVQLDWLSRAVLAPLVHAGRREGPIRLWSAGCAGGEEAHTLAVLLHELGASRHASILGTDISASAIRRARLATYGSFALRGASGERMRPYLERVGDRFRVRGEVRALSEFRRGNLAAPADASDPASGTVSVVVCRNVLLYFSEDAAAHAAERFARAVAPGGLLLTAPADPPLSEGSGWVRVPEVVGAYTRRQDAAAASSWSPAPPALPALPWASAPAWSLAASAPVEEEGAWRERQVPAAGDPPPSSTTDATPPEHGRRGDPPESPGAVDAMAGGLEMDAAVHHDRALRLLEAGEGPAALEAARRATYLAPELVMGHFTLALVALREGSVAIARRSYREAARLALAAPADEPLPMGDGLRAADVVRAAARQLERLGPGA